MGKSTNDSMGKWDFKLPMIAQSAAAVYWYGRYAGLNGAVPSVVQLRRYELRRHELCRPELRATRLHDDLDAQVNPMDFAELLRPMKSTSANITRGGAALRATL